MLKLQSWHPGIFSFGAIQYMKAGYSVQNFGICSVNIPSDYVVVIDRNTELFGRFFGDISKFETEYQKNDGNEEL